MSSALENFHVVLYNSMSPVPAQVLMQMQSGNHTLSSELRAANIDNFTITSTNARVMCTSTAAQVNLSSVQHVHISGVSFLDVNGIHFPQMETVLK